MRLLVLLLLAGVAAGEETRAWRGVITVRSVGRTPREGKGRETQDERIEFVMVHAPSATKGVPIAFRMRKAIGSYTLRVNTTERGVTTVGAGSGRLHPIVAGEVRDGRYRLEVRVTPRRLVALVTKSGIDSGRFQTFRMPLGRGCFLSSFKLAGNFGDAVIEGTRRFTDHKTKHPRDVVIAWRFERVDPVLRGKVVDHLGRPVAHMTMTARTTTPERARKRMPPHFREAKTGRDGRFAAPAFWAVWHVSFAPMLRDGILYVPRAAEPLGLRFDLCPDETYVADAYRLSDLPDAHLLAKRFRGDAARYLRHIRRRAGPDVLEAALVTAG